MSTPLVAGRIARDVICVEGPEAASYLQGQLSQDITGLAVGDTAWSFLLQPQGKVDALLRVTRVADEWFLLDTDGGWAESVLARLNRFKLRTKADIAHLDHLGCVAVRGDDADAVAQRFATDGLLARVPAGWPGIEGVDIIAEGITFPDGLADGGPAAIDAVRIAAGVPAMGSELTDATIPAEAGQWVIDAAVSFTKGCFTGQELVARIDSRGGHVPRQIRVVQVPDAQVLPVGAVLSAGADEVGVVTSAAPGVALASLKRTVEPSATVTVTGPSGAPVVVEVRGDR